MELKWKLCEHNLRLDAIQAKPFFNTSGQIILTLIKILSSVSAQSLIICFSMHLFVCFYFKTVFKNSLFKFSWFILPKIINLYMKPKTEILTYRKQYKGQHSQSHQLSHFVVEICNSQHLSDVKSILNLNH